MSSTARRILTIFALLFGVLGLGTAVSMAVVYKPFGVHDLEREKYEKMLEKISQQQKLMAEPRPVIVLDPVPEPSGVRQPAEQIESGVVITNSGSLPLTIDRHDSVLLSEDGILFRDAFPITIEPGQKHTCTYSWQVPESPEGLLRLRTTLITNDPLSPDLVIEPRCKIAKPFLLTEAKIVDTKRAGQPLIAVTRVLSERYDDIYVKETEKDTQLIVETKPETDTALLEFYNAKSGVVVTVTHPPRDTIGKISLPVEILVTNDVVTESLEVTFEGETKPLISFYGPDLDVRTGLSLGTVKTDSEAKWSFFARVEGECTLEEMQLNVKPDDLVASLSRARSGSNDLKITVQVKPGAKPFDFQAGRQGYVEISSKKNPSLTNWMPLRGVLVNPPRGN